MAFFKCVVTKSVEVLMDSLISADDVDEAQNKFESLFLDGLIDDYEVIDESIDSFDVTEVSSREQPSMLRNLRILESRNPVEKALDQIVED